MKKSLLALSFLLALPASFALAGVEPGKPAPDFEVKDINGKTLHLADFKGKWTVLEWTNKDCPYVKKHYGSGNMQKLQAEYTKKGVQWITVLSSAEGKQGFLTPEEAKSLYMKDALKSSKLYAVALDPKGTMGHAYDAKTTPDMVVINPKGEVAYAGAIDDNDSSDPKVIPKSKNYVRAALEAGMKDKPIEVTSSRSYGCSVKYAD